jgi:hypothetical protein
MSENNIDLPSEPVSSRIHAGLSETSEPVSSRIHAGLSETSEPVFRLKPIRNDPEDISECYIKHVGYITSKENLGDEVIELKTTPYEQTKYGKNIHTLGNINGYDITVRMYRNNMTGYYMINSKLLPVCSLQFMYSKSIVTGYLFNIFIYLLLDPRTIEFLKDAKSYVGARVNGKYVLILDSEDELNKNVDALYNGVCESFATEQLASELNDNINMSEEELLVKLKNIIEEKKIFYKSLIDGYVITHFKNINQFVEENLTPIYNNKHFIDIIKFALGERQKKRAKEYKAYDKEYKLPEKVLKLSDYQNNPELINKYLDIENDESDIE